jgi:4-amino-4-deoxy-L-arabinose transferase-like glycosyltransferase
MGRLLVPNSARHAFWEAVIICNLFQAALFIGGGLAGVTFPFGGFGHDGHLEISRNVVAGNGWVFEPDGKPVIHRPPVYPLLLTPMAILPSNVQRAVLIFLQSLLVGGLAAITFYNGRIWFGSRAASAATLITIANPWLHYAAKNPVPVLVQALLYGIVFTWVCNLVRRSYTPASRARNELLSGLLLGLVAGMLILSHAAMLLAFGLMVAAAAIAFVLQKQYRKLVSISVALLVAMLLTSIWTYRNWHTTGRFMPVAGNAGYAYFLGKAHWSDPCQNDRIFETGLEAAGFEKAEAANVQFYGIINSQLDESLDELMKKDVHAHPTSFAAKVLLNAAEYYFPVTWHGYEYLACGTKTAIKRLIEPAAISGFYFLQWAFGFAGVISLMRRGDSIRPVLLPLLGIMIFAAPYMPFLTYVGHSQYVFGTVPFLALFAVAGWQWSAKQDGAPESQQPGACDQRVWR